MIPKTTRCPGSKGQGQPSEVDLVEIHCLQDMRGARRGALLARLWYRAATACRVSSSGASEPSREVLSTMPAKLWTMSVNAFSLQSCAVTWPL